MSTFVKICGMTDEDAVRAAVDAGADAVGFVFYEKSPRNLSIERALELSSKNFIELLGNVLPEGSLKVKPSEESSSGGW